MTAFSIYPFEPDYGMLLPPDTLTLSDAEVNWAREQSQRISNPDERWQTYLNALARIGLQQWLEKRAPELLEDNQRFLRVAVDELCEVTVGSYRLYLIATDRVGDSEVAFSNTATSTAFNPHFYVLVEVFEELQQVRVCGYLSQSQTAQLLQNQTSPASVAEEITWLPITAFDLNADRLLLHLNCLEPETVAASRPVADLVESARSTAINAARWLNNQLDQMAQELSWVLLSPATEMRSASESSATGMRPLELSAAEMRSSEQLSAVVADLIERREIEVPPQVGRAYQDLQFAEQTVRLYALTWPTPGTANPVEWLLLVILGTLDGSNFNPTTRLQVRDETQLLADTTLERSQDRYLYAQVRGIENEQFYITVQQNQESIAVSPITFNAESN